MVTFMTRSSINNFVEQHEKCVYDMFQILQLSFTSRLAGKIVEADSD